jgi:AcrR family transcriptional regulator
MSPVPATADKMVRLEAARHDTRERILTEAERLFRHYGYSKTTVADIAQALSMSSANVYRFFGSKSEIVEAMAERMLGAKESASREIARLPLPASERLRMIVVACHQNTVETLIGETKVHEMVVVAMEEQWQVIQPHLNRMVGIFEHLITEGIAAGEFRAVDPHRAALCVHQAFTAQVHPQIVVQCRRDPSSYAKLDEMVDFVLAALKV